MRVVFLLALTASLAFSQEVCGTRVQAADEASANDRALAELSKRIAASISTETISGAEIIDGELSIKNSTYTSVRSAMRVAKGVKYISGKEQNGYFSQACLNVSGVNVESSSIDLKSKISSYLSKHGCVLSEEAASSAFFLKMDFNEEQQIDPIMGFAYCTPIIYVSLGNIRTGKNIFEDKIKGSKEGHMDMKKACELALEKSAADVWRKIQGKIQKEQCK